MGGGGQGRCEQRSEVFVKIEKKKILGGGGVGLGGQDGVERRIEVFVKIQKNGGGGGVDVNREVSFCENSKKNGGRGSGGGGGGSGWM